jgi:hypothetical protein
MSTKINNLNNYELVVMSPTEASNSGPWIPQTPDSQQGSDLKEQWQDAEE